MSDVTVEEKLALAWREGFVAGFVAINECDCAFVDGGCPTCLAYAEAAARNRMPLPSKAAP